MARRGNGEGSIYYDKTKKCWVASICIGVDTTTGKTIRRRVYADNNKDIITKKNDMLAKYKDTYYMDADRITVGDWVSKYLDTYKKGSVRQNTYESYLYLAKHYITPHLGTVKLDKLVPIQIQHFVNDLAAQHSPRTAEYVLAILKMAIRRAVDENILVKDVTRGIKKPRKKAKEIHPLTPEDVQILIDKTTSDKMKMAIKILYMTGMRSEELLGLTWNKINFAKQQLTISQVIIRTKDGPIIEAPKTQASARAISLPPKLLTALKNYKKLQAAEILKNKNYQNQNFVICRQNGLPMMPVCFCNLFGRNAKNADIAITAHGLRHTHATQLFKAGWNAKDVQERLGHSSVSVTLDIYTHHVPQRQNDIAAYLDQICPN